jgi:UPF0176 protein
LQAPQDDIHAVLQWLRSDPRLADLEHKEAWASEAPFYRMKVRLKAEIVTMHVPGLDPSRTVGQYVTPQHWNALISEPDVVLVDTRNDYEVAIGTFRGALDPQTRSFSELPAWVQAQSAPGKALAGANGKKPRVAMFCTGGIRCEKSTAYLRSQGFEEVYHLQGGILKYLETIAPEHSLWQGECFVFDERVSVGHGLQEGQLICAAPAGAPSETPRRPPTNTRRASAARIVSRADRGAQARFCRAPAPGGTGPAAPAGPYRRPHAGAPRQAARPTP